MAQLWRKMACSVSTNFELEGAEVSTTIPPELLFGMKQVGGFKLSHVAAAFVLRRRALRSGSREGGILD